MTNKTWVESFWARVNKTESCWLWTAGRDSDGYGIFGSTRPWSRSFRAVKEVRAPRVSWVIHHGPIPKGAWVLHSCDTPACVNPDHLFLGDNITNSRDRDLKGRHRGCIGETCGHTPLTDDSVRRIRRLWDTGSWSQQELAELYEINQSSISEIVRGVSWRHIL